MKKKVAGLLTIMLFISGVVCAQVRADETAYYDRITYKLGRGVSNVVFSPIEIARSIDDRVESYGFGAGVSIGLFHGLGRTIARIATGLFDVVTFPFADAPKPAYYMEPEFAFDITA